MQAAMMVVATSAQLQMVTSAERSFAWFVSELMRIRSWLLGRTRGYWKSLLTSRVALLELWNLGALDDGGCCGAVEWLDMECPVRRKGGQFISQNAHAHGKSDTNLLLSLYLQVEKNPPRQEGEHGVPESGDG
jgi:hypothetical protein